MGWECQEYRDGSIWGMGTDGGVAILFVNRAVNG